MKVQRKLPANPDRIKQMQQIRESALGLVSTRSFPAIIGTADMMVKSAGVILVGYEKIGSGYCTAIVRGKVADVRLAVEEGARVAEQIEQLVSKSVIPRPMPNMEVVFPLGSRLAEFAFEQQGSSRLSNQAIGLLETRGFPAMVGAADAMLKSANVQLAAYETIGDGLCTAIIRGSVANVAVAVEAGMYEAERIGELNAVMVIPRPLEDLEHALPVASCWIEQPEPLPVLIPKALKQEVVPQPLKIPDVEKVPIAIEESQPVVEPQKLSFDETQPVVEPQKLSFDEDESELL